MPQNNCCPVCGTKFGPDAPGGICPRCLADIGAADTLSPIESTAGDGQANADYELLELIGKGGMGMVYRARQLSLGREVAFKIIKPGMDSTQVLARFNGERAALTRMDHPNIARVIDAGQIEPALADLNPQLSSSLGRPYFVMELVQGIPITSYCVEQRLGIPERLGLFISVCHAIQHAHQKGIIHRDIKPSNVFVTVENGKPVPKVIDFGLAKAIGPRLTEESFVTEFGVHMGTPAYMSPEQAGFDPADIDTRSDIYALGILLYELLTHTTPLNRQTLKKAAFDEVLRLIREEEPPRPSTRLATELASASTPSAAPQSQFADRKSKIPPDLDWIVMKCLEKDRRRRYETASTLAEDIQRHLHNEPITARPPSAAYRLQKLVHRNRLAFSAAAAVLFAVAGGVAAVFWQWDKARRALRDSQLTTEILRDALRNLRIGLDEDERKSVLERLKQRLNAELPHRPEVQADLLGQVHHSLGDLPQAEAHLRLALDLYQKRHGPNHPDVASAYYYLGIMICMQSNDRRTEAEPYLRRALAMGTELYGPESPKLDAPRFSLAWQLRRMHKLGESESLFAQIHTNEQKRHGPRSVEAALAARSVIQLMLDQKKFAAAVPLARDALRVLTQFRPNAWQTFDAQSLLGGALSGQGNSAEAEKFLLAGCEGMMARVSTNSLLARVSVEEGMSRLLAHFEATGDSREAEWRRNLAAWSRMIEERASAAGGNLPAGVATNLDRP